jgi:hypothetical protein
MKPMHDCPQLTSREERKNFTVYSFMFQYYAAELSRPGSRREGWGSAEATEMVLNNLFYITAKVSEPLYIY